MADDRIEVGMVRRPGQCRLDQRIVRDQRIGVAGAAGGEAAFDAPTRDPIDRPVVDRGATIRGRALWWSGIDASRRARKHISKVDFLVDGMRQYTDHTWPFAFHRPYGWDSRTVANGRHMLSVRAYGARGYRAWRRIPVRVANPPMRVGVTGALPGDAVAGVVTLEARPSQPV